MNPTPPDEKQDYLEHMAGKLDDPDAYLRFLEAKLDEHTGLVLESGVLSTVADDDAPAS